MGLISHVLTTNMIGTSQNEKEEDIYEILATEIPLAQQNTPKDIAAKQAEYENYVKFDAFEDIKDVGQERLKT